MESLLALIALVCVTAGLHAWMEIEIEGPHGWASKLPTAPFDNAITRILFGSPITRYHVAMGLTILAFAHIPVLFVQPWSVANELIIIGYTILHLTLEDFLWFVFNPAFGLRKFKREHIWWHKRWIFKLPLGYWIAMPLSLFLILVGMGKIL